MTLELLNKRAKFIQALREFFIEKDYLEVETPTLSPFLIPEPCLEVFATQYLNERGKGQKLYLAPSPELWMKRVLAMGSGNIFQICKCFRNLESRTRLHNPEFPMLEWYTVNKTYMDIMGQMEELCSFLLDKLKKKAETKICGHTVNLTPPFLRMSFKQAFLQILNTDLDNLFSRIAIKKLAKKLGIDCRKDDTWEQVFHKIFLTHIESQLPRDKPLLLFDFPGKIPTLARQKANTPYCQRWELYMGGIEIANCYTEETDIKKIKALIKAETKRKKACRQMHKIDYKFTDIFEKDFPECTGVALGVDRLFMVFNELDSIAQTMAFPFKDF